MQAWIEPTGYWAGAQNGMILRSRTWGWSLSIERVAGTSDWTVGWGGYALNDHNYDGEGTDSVDSFPLGT